MTSDAQIAANRENAQKSTGPRTPEGKAISSRNAVKPGTAGRRCSLCPEDSLEYAKLGQLYILDLKPSGIFESTLVESIVDNHWQLNRARAGMEEICSRRFGITTDFEILLRLEKRLENAIMKAEASLRGRQKFRKGEENYGTIIQFEDKIRKPYKPKIHGHLPRMIRFVSEEIDSFLYFQQMEEEAVVNIQKEEDEKAAEKAKETEPPPPTEAVIG